MSEPLLEVNNLRVSFEGFEGTAEVINGVDFTIERGETAALVGETGCGKSVTVKSIMGLLSEANIESGEILFKGEDLLQLSEKEVHAKRGRQMSMILQDPMSALNPVLTVGTQMVDVLQWQGREKIGYLEWIKSKFNDSEEYREQAINMLEEVDISAPERVFSSYPFELSGGMRQRVLIAIALLTEPDFLIADEPGTALDVTTESKVLDLLDGLIQERDTSVLYITHDLGVAKQVSDYINVMYAGEIVEQAPTEKLFDQPHHPYTRGLLDSIPKLSVEIGDGIPGQIPDYTNPPTGCRFAERCSYSESECVNQYPYHRRVDDDHVTACHLYQGEPIRERHRDKIDAPVFIGPPPWGESNEKSSVTGRESE